jgi:hypothetical protein
VGKATGEKRTGGYCMINYEELEDAALFGIEESLSYGDGVPESESCYLEDEEGIMGDCLVEEMAEALYCKYAGLSD